MTLSSHCRLAVFIAALVACCVVAELPPVVVTCTYMELVDEGQFYYESAYEEEEALVFHYSPGEDEEIEIPFIYPLFANASFTVENMGDAALEFVYSSIVTNTTDVGADIPSYSFKPSVSGGTNEIPVDGSVKFDFVFDTESFSGDADFAGLITIFMAFKTEDKSFDPISFRALSEVFIPGCKPGCSGHCIEKIKHCLCEEPWTGSTCQSSFKILNNRSSESDRPEVCPGEPLYTSYAFVSTSCIGYWSIYDLESTEPTYDTGSLYDDNCLKGSSVPETNMTITTYLEPGDYRFVYFQSFGVEQDGEVYFHVKDWSECGGEYDCNTDPGNKCHGNGECATEEGETKGKCTCGDSHFWKDCSRGCDEATILTARTGIIDSDSDSEQENENPLYVQSTNCTWYIIPEGKGVDKIRVEFSRFSLNSANDNVIVRTLNSDGQIDKNSRLLAKYGGTSLPQTKEFETNKIALVFSTSYQGSSLGFRLNYTVITEPISGGVIAAIIVVVAVVVICIIAAAVILSVRRKKRLTEALNFAKGATSEPWLLQEGEDEIVKGDRALGNEGELPEHSELEKILGWMDMKDIEFECSDYDLRFGLEERMPCPVMVEQKQVITITNASNVPLAFCFFHPVENYMLQCSLVPGKGTLAPGTGIRVKVTLKLMYTTRVDASIKCAVWRGARGPGEFYAFATADGLVAPGPNDKPAEDSDSDPNQAFRDALVKSTPLKTARLTFHLEGAVSERIDPGELVLNPEPLGEGAYGVVYSGRYRGRFVAVKVMSRQHDLLEQITKDFEKEIDLYRRLHNQLIVEFVGASLIPGKLCMCTELIQRGSLEQLLSETEISLALQLRFAMNVAEAVQFLHSNNVMHRDLKPSNIMVVSTSLNSKVNCKIGDFGTARNVKDVTEFFLYTQGQGTPVYMAPEMLAVKPYNCKADVYSYAVTLWQMASREKPWLNVPVWDIPSRVIHGKRPQMPSDIPKEYAELIRKCWAPKPDDRPAFNEIMEMLTPLAKRAKKDVKKDGGKGKHGAYLGGVTESTVDFNMTLDETQGTDGNAQTTDTTTTTTTTAPVETKKHDGHHDKKKKKKKKKKEQQ